MKRISLVLLLLLGACSRPQVVPDEELAQIFRDAFLTNAYANRERVVTDSLKVYEPIFARYGYSQEDVQYTIANFSKRKSARLSDVVEQAIKLLDDQGDYYDHEVAVLDTIDKAARRAMRRKVYADTLIRVRSLRDSSRLRIVVPDVRPGEYMVSLSYEIDSLDRNQTQRGGAWIEKQASSSRSLRTFVLRRGKEERFTRTLTTDTSSRRLVVDFAGFQKSPKRPSITLRDVEITYTMPLREAVDSFYHREVDVRIFADEFFGHDPQKDSL